MGTSTLVAASANPKTIPQTSTKHSQVTADDGSTFGEGIIFGATATDTGVVAVGWDHLEPGDPDIVGAVWRWTPTQP